MPRMTEEKPGPLTIFPPATLYPFLWQPIKRRLKSSAKWCGNGPPLLPSSDCITIKRPSRLIRTLKIPKQNFL